MSTQKNTTVAPTKTVVKTTAVKKAPTGEKPTVKQVAAKSTTTTATVKKAVAKKPAAKKAVAKKTTTSKKVAPQVASSIADTTGATGNAAVNSEMTKQLGTLPNATLFPFPLPVGGAATVVKKAAAKKSATAVKSKAQLKADITKRAKALIAEAKKAGWVLSIPLEAGKPVVKLYETA